VLLTAFNNNERHQHSAFKLDLRSAHSSILNLTAFHLSAHMDVLSMPQNKMHARQIRNCITSCCRLVLKWLPVLLLWRQTVLPTVLEAGWIHFVLLLGQNENVFVTKAKLCYFNLISSPKIWQKKLKFHKFGKQFMISDQYLLYFLHL
jgi:hypothetical protein